MSQAPTPPPDINDLLRQQRELLAAQQEFIRLQQRILAPRMIKEGVDPITIDPTEGEGRAMEDILRDDFPRHPAGGPEVEGETTPVSLRAIFSTSFLARHGFSMILPMILSVLVVALLFRNPKEMRDLRMQMKQLRDQHFEELSQSSSELQHAQHQLMINQQALLQTEQNLIEAQESLAQMASGRPAMSTSTGQAGATQASATATVRPAVRQQAAVQTPAPARSVVTREEQAMDQLLQLASNCHQVNEELRKNQLEYRETFRVLAQVRLQIAKIKLQPGAAEPVIADFIPEGVAQLMSEEALSVSLGTFVPSPEWSGLDLNKVALLMKEKDAELRAGQRKLTQVQNDIRRTQAELTAAQAELEILAR